MNKYKLSIIIPFYKCEEYVIPLMEKLINIINNDIEIIVVDDGCYFLELDKYETHNIRILHTKNMGVSHARNVGLDMHKGEIVAFIDSDDMVTDDYVQEFFKFHDYDMCYFDWRAVGLANYVVNIPGNLPPEWNWAVWNAWYRSDLIGDLRFNESLKTAEDVEFNQEMRKRAINIKNVNKILYLYTTGRPNSLTNNP